MRGTWRILVVVAVVLAWTGDGRAANACKTGCDTVYEATKEACLSDAVDQRETCLSKVGDKWSTCVDDCRTAWTAGGRCTLLRECLNACRGERAGSQYWCRHKPQRPCVRAAKAERAECRAACRGDAQAAPQAARRALPPLRPAEPVAAPQASSLSGCGCWAACTSSVLDYCYGRCASHCEHDTLALSICQENCRNYLCDDLTARCTKDGSEKADYVACCNRCGEACEQTPACTSPN